MSRCGNCPHDPDAHSPVNLELCSAPNCPCPGLLTVALPVAEPAASREPLTNEQWDAVRMEPDPVAALSRSNPPASAEAEPRYPHFEDRVRLEAMLRERRDARVRVTRGRADRLHAAIRSAGTPPAIRDEATLPCGYVFGLTGATCGKRPEHTLHRAGSHDATPTTPVHDYEPTERRTATADRRAAAAPPEPVGGREASDCEHRIVETFAATGLSVWACSECRLRFYPACRECVDVGHRGVAHVQASPPTGVSGGVALDVERLARAMAAAEGDFVGKHSLWTSKAERAAAEYLALAREQADSEPEP